MSVYGKCEKCGNPTVDYVCPTCIVKELEEKEKLIAEAVALARPTDDEIETRLAAVKYPNGPEDKVLEEEELSWEVLRDFAKREDWPLSSKLARCLIKVGAVAEYAVERAQFFKLTNEKLEAAISKLENRRKHA